MASSSNSAAVTGAASAPIKPEPAAPPQHGRALPYSDVSGLNAAEGYIFSLTLGQERALALLRERLQESGRMSQVKMEVRRPAETVDTFLLRFLRARDFEVEAAYEFLVEDLSWRAKKDVHALKTKTLAEVLGCSEEDAATVMEGFPSYQHGFDRSGMPVIYRAYGEFEIWKMTKLTTVDRLVDLHIWENEHSLDAMNARARETGEAVEALFVVIDAADWSIMQATGEAIRYLKGLADADSNHFPERLGRLFVINAPFMLTSVWNIVKTWLAPRTIEKIQIYGARREWEPALKRYVDQGSIPEKYGGVAPAASSAAPPAASPAASNLSHIHIRTCRRIH